MRAVLTIFAIWAAGLGAAAQFGKMSVAYPALESAYGDYAGIGIGLMVSVVGTVGLIFGTTAGLLVARIGPRRAIVAALALGALVSAVQTSFPPYPVMMLTRILEGLSHLAIVVVGPTAIAGLATQRFQGAAMTLWSSFFGVAYAGLFYFGPTMVLSQGPGALFGLHALWMAVCAAVMFVLLPRDAMAMPFTPSSAMFSTIIGLHRNIYASPFIAAPAMGFVCYTVTYVAILTLLPAQMGKNAALIGVAMPLVSIAVSLTLGVWLLSKMKSVALVQAGFSVAMLASLGLWATWGQGAAIWFAVLLAASLGIVQGASFASLAELNQSADDRAMGAGAIAQLGNLGTTTGTPMLVLALDKAGATGLVMFLIGFSALGIAVHAVQARRRISAEQRHLR